MLEILEGAIVTGKSGKPLKVISIDGDGLVLEYEGGVVKAKRSAILRVISPPATKKPAPLAIGDNCYYCGTKYWEQYGGLELKVALLREGYWSCTKPDGYYTTNILPSELSRSPVAKPTKKSPERIPRAGRWMLESELEKAMERPPDSCQYLGD